jgi:choline dehydrogenase
MVPRADLFIFGLPARFEGYYPGYSRDLARQRDVFTWAILKAHTKNTAGTVTLRSRDPQETPDIDFRYFDEGSPGADHDLDAVVWGIEFVRRMAHRSGMTAAELVPGDSVVTREELREFVRTHAWGHHASCTCKIGRDDDPTAVLDGRFRVRGTRNLRVVDASVFPRIPGYFIVTPTYMISEKASDAVLADAGVPVTPPA